MAKEDRFLLALDFLCEGSKAVVPSKLSRKTFATESFRKATKKLERSARPWTRGSGVQGMGLGEKITQGKVGKSLSLRVYVDKKKPLSKLKNRVPKQVAVPELGKLTTDVVEIGRVERESFTEGIRPAMPGCGVGHTKVPVGTFGCLVRLNSSPQDLYILSNSHVLANEGVCRQGDPILQQGKLDGGKLANDVIGTLHAWKPFKFGWGYRNRVDAAIAKVAQPRVLKEIRILGFAPVGASFTVRRGMRVQKVGRTTDFTVGEVTDVNYRLKLKYKKPGGGSGQVGLRDQVLCTRFTAVGDSGAAVLNSRKRVVGLHFAGSASASIFNRIEHVFDELDLRLA